MTTSRFWNDPLEGASYSFGERLTSTQQNSYVDGLRKLDQAIDALQAFNWVHTASGVGENDGQVAVWNSIAGNFITYYGATGNYEYTPNLDPIGSRTVDTSSGAAPSARAIAVDPTGIVVVGGVPDSTGAPKFTRAAANGAYYTTVAATAGTSQVMALAHNAYHSSFVAGLKYSTSPGVIQTSSDGQTWTARTTPNTNAVSSIACDKLGVTVAVSSANTAKALRSSDLDTWTEVNLPATARWNAVAYVPGLGKWFVSSSSSNQYAESTNGTTWSSVAPTYTGVMASNDLGHGGRFTSMAALNNHLIAGWRNDLYASTDGHLFRCIMTVAARIGVTGIDVKRLTSFNGGVILVAGSSWTGSSYGLACPASFTA
jgi:hypothetical protein